MQVGFLSKAAFENDHSVLKWQVLYSWQNGTMREVTMLCSIFFSAFREGPFLFPLRHLSEPPPGALGQVLDQRNNKIELSIFYLALAFSRYNKKFKTETIKRRRMHSGAEACLYRHGQLLWGCA